MNKSLTLFLAVAFLSYSGSAFGVQHFANQDSQKTLVPVQTLEGAFGVEAVTVTTATIVREGAAEPSREPLANVALGLLQDDTRDRQRTGLYKIFGGILMAGAGVYLASTAKQSETFPILGAEVTCSCNNSGQVVGGIAAAGAGLYLIFSGSKDRWNW